MCGINGIHPLELAALAHNGIHPLELAALAHQKFVFIHFVDGNGRVALLLMNQVLLHFEYPITIIPPSLGLEYIVASENNL